MGGSRVFLLLTVALFGVIASGNPVENHNNETETESEILEDILGKWLKDFGTYTYLLDQDADEGEDEVTTRVVPEVTSVVPENNDDEDVDDYEKGSSAPISISIDKATTLLDPELDYTVKLESLVAEGGSVLVTLASFQNKTSCGVGGFTLQPENRERIGQEGRLNITHQQEGNRSTTIVAFAVDNEAENSTTWQLGDEGSAWEELSRNLWWAKGKLAGGGVLTLTFTPPECDCLILKAHYAFSIGDNLTLVVGPETYPKDLEMLICVDPAMTNKQENLNEMEVEEGGITAEALERVDAFPDNDEDADDDAPKPHSKVGRGRGKWADKKLKRERKRRRQEARQAIRQAGKKVTRKRVMKHMRLQRRHDDSEETVENRQGNHRAGKQRGGGGGGGGGGKWARKQARKQARKHAKQAKKAWKKQRKNSRRNKHNRRNRFNKNQNVTEDAIEISDDHVSTTLAPTDEDAAADILLSDDAEMDEEEEEEEEAAGSPAGHHNRRRGRKQRKTRGKQRNRQQNKEQRKGIKFCCKRGIKYKKSHFSNSTDEGVLPEVSCSDTEDIISTFAEHQFGIDKEQCAARFETCCTKFSPQLWENVKTKKAARKAKRKEQRKARQQKRRQQRQQTSTTSAP